MRNTKQIITIFINDREYKVKNGSNLLWIALDNDLYIPNLCAIKEINQFSASCRLCFVEIEGRKAPVISCKEKAVDGMKIYLDTEKVKRVRNTAFELLLSNHPIECAQCDKNRNCELQEIAAKTGAKLKLYKYRKLQRDLAIDYSHPKFYYNPNKCVLCGRCIQICQMHGSGVLDFAFRGINTIVSVFNNIPLAEACTDACLSCVTVCPVGSLVIKNV